MFVTKHFTCEVKMLENMVLKFCDFLLPLKNISTCSKAFCCVSVVVQSLKVDLQLPGEDVSRKLGEVLEVRRGDLEMPPGFHAKLCMVMSPPSPVTTVAQSTSCGLYVMLCLSDLLNPIFSEQTFS